MGNPSDAYSFGCTTTNCNSSSSSNSSSRFSAGASGKLSAYVFLLVIGLHLITSFVQSCLFTLLPVWMVIPLGAGGLDYGVKDVALVLSGAALLVLVLRALLEARTEHILKASPVRSLRIGCGIVFLVSFLIPWFLAHHRLLAPLLEAAVPLASQQQTYPQLHFATQRVSVFSESFEASRPLSYSTLSSSDHHNIAYDAALLAVSRSMRLPSHSLTAALLPSALLALMVCGLYLCRRSSAVLLQLTLQRVFQSPAALYRAITLFLEALGPLAATLLFSVVYGLRLKAPLDGSFFFAQSSVLILLVYMGSVPLKVQFRGDYGVMTDYQERHFGPQANQQQPQQQKQRRLQSAYQMQQQSSESSRALPASSSSSSSSRGLHLRSSSSAQLHSAGGADGSFSQRGALSPHQISTTAAAAAIATTPAATTAAAVAAVVDPSLLMDVLSIPLADLHLLCATTDAAYGTKLHNLKDDFKHV